MHLATTLTLPGRPDDRDLFPTTKFDELLNAWDEQHQISMDHWSHFPRRSTRSSYETSLVLLDEIKHVIDEYYTHRLTDNDETRTALVAE